MSFPISPSNGQISIVNNIQYQYNSANNFWVRLITPTYFPSNFAITNTTDSVSNTTGALTIAGGLGVGGNVYANSIYINGLYYAANGNTFSSGAITSGYLNNAVIFANTLGYLSNTNNLSYTSSNNTLIVSNVTTPTIYTTSGGVVFPDGTSQNTSFLVFTQAAYNQANAATTAGATNATLTQAAFNKANAAAIFSNTAGALATANNYQMNSLGVNTAASGTAGEIRATNNITAYYSDDRLKTKLGNIQNALDKLKTLSGFYYEANEIAQSLGYTVQKEVGVSAQQVQAVLPEIVVPAPIDDKYLTVRYEKLIPLLIEAIKEQQEQIDKLNETVDKYHHNRRN
jgi:hypothetical protein